MGRIAWWSLAARPDRPIAAATDRRRSLPLTVFTPLAALSGSTFYSLQKGPPAAQLVELRRAH